MSWKEIAFEVFMPKTRKTLFFVAGVLVCAIGAGWWYIDSEYDKFFSNYDSLYGGLLSKELAKHEDAFQANPNLEKCVYLADKFYFLAGDLVTRSHSRVMLDQIESATKKALMYGQKCVELGSDFTSSGWLIRFWLADLQMKRGLVSDAEKSLSIALKLDRENTLQASGWIEKSNLKEIYKKIKTSQ